MKSLGDLICISLVAMKANILEMFHSWGFPSFKNSISGPRTIFWMDHLIFWLCFLNILIYSGYYLLSDLANTLCYSLDVYFILLIISLSKQTTFSFMGFHLLIVGLNSYANEVLMMTSFLKTISCKEKWLCFHLEVWDFKFHI